METCEQEVRFPIPKCQRMCGTRVVEAKGAAREREGEVERVGSTLGDLYTGEWGELHWRVQLCASSISMNRGSKIYISNLAGVCRKLLFTYAS
jgi:hypothetical protein